MGKPYNSQPGARGRDSRVSGLIARCVAGGAILALLFQNAAAAETIEDALAAAYAYSPALRSAHWQLNATNEQRPQALAGWLPTITVGANAGQSQPNQPRVLGPTSRSNQWGGSLNATLPITQGGGEWARLRNAENTIKAARASFLAQEQSVLSNAATAFLDVRSGRAIVRAETQNVEALRQMARMVQQQVAAGDRTVTDLTLAQARLTDAEAGLSSARATLSQAEARYVNAIGRSPGPVLDPPKPLTILPRALADVRSLAETVNPTVMSSVYNALAARDNIDQAVSALLPSLALVISAQDTKQAYPSDYKPYVNGFYVSRSVSLQLTVPLYQGGSEYSTVRAAKKTAFAREHDREAARIDAISAAEQAWYTREGALRNVKLYGQSFRQNETLVAQYNRQVAAGETTVFEALQGLSAKVGAEIALRGAEHDVALSDYTVLATVGGLTARTLNLKVTYYDPTGDYQQTKWRIWGLKVQ